MKNKKKKAVVSIVLSGDRNADWIKLVDGGKHKRSDLAAHEAAQKLHDEQTKKDEQ